MAGHSKWANIKHRKARQDAVKGKAWSKCSKAIMAAARAGGGDPEMNLSLRYAIEEAKSVNMPKDTIEKAIKKGAGELGPGETIHEIRYEGYGPGGVAIMIDCITDNLNRTAPEIRKLFEKAGGNLGVSGSVAFGFSQRGAIYVEAGPEQEDRVMEVGLEAGAEDIKAAEGGFEILTQPADCYPVRDALESAGLKVVSAEVTMVPNLLVACSGSNADRVVRMLEALEEHDDVQKVYANCDIVDADDA